MSQETKGKNWVEELEVSGKELVQRVEEIIQRGDARRVVIKDSSGDELLGINLNVGVVAGGILVLAAPVLAALGALAALVARVRLEVVRVAPEQPVKEQLEERQEVSSQ